MRSTDAVPASSATTPVWEVEARQGEADDGKSQRCEFTDEDEAIAMVNKLMTTGRGEWRDLTGVSAKWTNSKISRAFHVPHLPEKGLQGSTAVNDARA